MSNQSAAFAVYPSSVVLTDVVKALGRGGFSNENLFMLLSPTHPVSTVMRESSRRALEQDTNMATSKLLGWLSDFGAVIIPTFGFFIRSREFFQSLNVGRESVPGYGGRTLASLGFSRDDAERLEKHALHVGALVYVSCDGAARSQYALEILRTIGAEEAGLLRSRTPNDAREFARETPKPAVIPRINQEPIQQTL